MEEGKTKTLLIQKHCSLFRPLNQSIPPHKHSQSKCIVRNHCVKGIMWQSMLCFWCGNKTPVAFNNKIPHNQHCLLWTLLSLIFQFDNTSACKYQFYLLVMLHGMGGHNTAFCPSQKLIWWSLCWELAYCFALSKTMPFTHRFLHMPTNGNDNCTYCNLFCGQKATVVFSLFTPQRRLFLKWQTFTSWFSALWR